MSKLGITSFLLLFVVISLGTITSYRNVNIMDLAHLQNDIRVGVEYVNKAEDDFVRSLKNRELAQGVEKLKFDEVEVKGVEVGYKFEVVEEVKSEIVKMYYDSFLKNLDGVKSIKIDEVLVYVDETPKYLKDTNRKWSERLKGRVELVGGSLSFTGVDVYTATMKYDNKYFNYSEFTEYAEGGSVDTSKPICVLILDGMNYYIDTLFESTEVYSNRHEFNQLHIEGHEWDIKIERIEDWIAQGEVNRYVVEVEGKSLTETAVMSIELADGERLSFTEEQLGNSSVMVLDSFPIVIEIRDTKDLYYVYNKEYEIRKGNKVLSEQSIEKQCEL